MSIGMWLACSGFGALGGWTYGKYQSRKKQDVKCNVNRLDAKTYDSPFSPKQITCACCHNPQWVEKSSNQILCSECLDNGCDIGMGERA